MFLQSTQMIAIIGNRVIWIHGSINQTLIRLVRNRLEHNVTNQVTNDDVIRVGSADVYSANVRIIPLTS